MEKVTQQSILKNVPKFRNIKLKPSLCLDNCPMVYRYDPSDPFYKPSTGISTGLFGDRWFIVNNQKAIFKTFECAPLCSLMRLSNELICQELANQIDLPCAKYELAKHESYNGLISYNIAKNTEEIFSGRMLLKFFGIKQENCIINYYNAMKQSTNKGYNVNKVEEMIKMYKLCILDYLTLQTDRHMSNVNFLIDYKTKEIHFAPIIDNEMAFCCMDIYEDVLDIYDDKNMTVKDILDKYNKGHMLSIYPLEHIIPKDQEIKQQIVLFAKEVKLGMNTLKYVLKNIDIKKAIANVEKNDIKISSAYKNFVYSLFEYNKEQLLKCLEFEISNFCM